MAQFQILADPKTWTHAELDRVNEERAKAGWPPIAFQSIAPPEPATAIAQATFEYSQRPTLCVEVRDVFDDRELQVSGVILVATGSDNDPHDPA